MNFSVYFLFYNVSSKVFDGDVLGFGTFLGGRFGGGGRGLFYSECDRSVGKK